MESDSDGDGELEATFTSMRQPPLIKQLRGILSEYPDGGQIIKELLQNAEDAGASEVKILCDSRSINQQPARDKVYTKFFQAPALCVHNDAVFTDQDWEGIEMIYSSVKEEDKMKVGRFGLGFKSVFHITDYPCVISGKYLLAINPQQKNPNKVNAKMELQHLHKYKGMDITAFQEALLGTFGLDENSLKRGFEGTMFWFPLRQKPSEITETLYSPEKVYVLFEALKSEASCVLIFLKTLKKISLFERKHGNICTEIERTELIQNAEKGLEERSRFREKLLATQNCIPEAAISSCAVLTVEVSNFRHMTIKEIFQWLVVNYLMGKNASDHFMKLIKNKQLGLTPYVGIAAPLGSNSSDFLGHIFCFLPLPKEGARHTGLPFHVNGFFSLSQNRHHLKWATDEQDIEKVQDNSIQWNQKLITECLPMAYKILLKELVIHSQQNQNTPKLMQSVYNAIPDPQLVQDKKWMTFLEKMQIQDLPLMLRRESISRRDCEWITVKRARFATLSHMPGTANSNFKPAVIKALSLLGEEFVDVKEQTFGKLSRLFNVIDLTPQIFSSLLKRNNICASMTSEDRQFLLEYLISDRNYNNIEGLEMLPLASGAWTTFSGYSKAVYVCTDEEIQLLPGLENRILLPRHDLHKDLAVALDDLTRAGYFQLQKMDSAEMIKLIPEVLTYHLGSSLPKYIKTKGSLTISWVQKVWKYFLSKGDLSCMVNIPLFPLLRRGTWPLSSDDWELVDLSSILILKESGGSRLSDNICNSLQCLSVKIVPSLPEWIPKSEIQRYIYMPSSSSVVEIMSRIGSLSNCRDIARSFNDKTSAQCKREFLQFIGQCANMDSNAKKLMKLLKIFEELDSIMGTRGFVSLMENNIFVGNQCLPVRYPRQYINMNNCSKYFLTQLGTQEVSINDLILTTIQCIVSEHYTTDEKMSFMQYFVRNFNQFEYHHEIVQAARNIRFLRTTSGHKRLSEVFDPHNAFLKDLFEGEDRFPSPAQTEVRHLNTFYVLGLQTINHVNANILKQTATVLDKWAMKKKQDDQMKRKSVAFLKCLKKKPELLEEYGASGHRLKVELSSLKCIHYETNANSSFPLPWHAYPYPLCSPNEARHIQMYQLVGSTMPLVEAGEKLWSAFGWDSLPPLNKVGDQLQIVKNSYKVTNKPDILPLIKCIYQHLDERKGDMLQIASKDLIWVDDRFVSPRQAIIQRCNLDLRPYMFHVPAEFSCFENLFTKLGCNVQQTTDVLLQTLSDIKQYHSTAVSHSLGTVNHDTELAFNILEKLSHVPNEIRGKERKIYIPTQTEETELKLKPMPECVYDSKRRYFLIEDIDETVYFIHEGLKLGIAEQLGIRSLDRMVLSETEELAFEKWGQDEPLTARIKTLLKEGYKDGLSVPKELIQNADDAGATELKFLYDERENNNMKKHLFSPEMKECQGPALWVYNNSRFSKADLENITKLNGATKANDSSTIGKFGLGFCSVYNLTDVPSFISGSNIVVFDPHQVYLPENCPGMKIDLKKKQNRYLLRQHKDQFRHFENVFGCQLPGPDFQEFDGTLFRFPLRTTEQAHQSKIKSKPYTRDKVCRLLGMFMKAAGNMFLFTQHLKKLEIYHLPPSNESLIGYTMLFKMTRSGVCQQTMSVPDSLSVLHEAEQKFQSGIQFRQVQHLEITLEVSKQAEDLFQDINLKAFSGTSSWLVSWALGTSHALADAREMKQKGALPLASVALPVHDFKSLMPVSISEGRFGFYTCGHVYCFLPLPISTSLQAHINACFNVSSDRRQLQSISEDDMNSKGASWNQALLKDSLVISFVQLLAVLAGKHLAPASYLYYSLWPIESDRLLKPFQDSFYAYITSARVNVFHAQNKWISFQDIVFLEPKLQGNAEIGNTAFATLEQFQPRKGKWMVQMPNHLLDSIKGSIGSPRTLQHMICEEELFAVFFDNILDPFWNSRTAERDKMVLYALTSSSEKIKSRLQTTSCIPSEPNGNLHEPKYFVDPTGPLADMFTSDDGFFPTDKSRFRSPEILSRLRRLGMMYGNLSATLLVNRCESVKKVASICCECAFKRCKNVVQYLSSSSVQDDFSKDQQLLTSVKQSLLVPALSCPSKWVFPWKCDTDKTLLEFTVSKSCGIQHGNDNRCSRKFGLINQFFSCNAKDYVGLVRSIMDESVISLGPAKNILKVLGIDGRVNKLIPTNVIIEQVLLLSDSFMENRKEDKQFKHLLDTSFNLLNERLSRTRNSDVSEDTLSSIEKLKCKPVVLIGKDLVVPSAVAYYMEGECRPDLYQLPDTEAAQRKDVYNAIGVVECFAPDCILNVLQQKKNMWGSKPCKDIDVIVHLLQNFVYSMEKHHVSINDFDSTSIVAPDKNSVLTPTCDLVEDDDNFKTSLQMKSVHDSISPKIAKAIGVKQKDRKCLEKISVGIPFGQKEKLVNRLKTLLNAYPRDGSIMKELLQNADDANATEIHFIKDYRIHSSQEKSFGDRYNELQGPALCVFNDSFFTEDDLEGIQNLGEGSKANDPTKTGQYGVGFNAVYHLTDAPSFLTKGPDVGNGGTLCILDPLCKYIPDVTKEEPGRRYEVDGLRESFPGVLSGFLEHESFFNKGRGTMFRFPLRHTRSEISGDVISNDTLNSILSALDKDMFEALLFVKNVESITISNVTSGQLQEEYSVHVVISEQDKKKRKQFFEKVNAVVGNNYNDKLANVSAQRLEVGYEMLVKDSLGQSEKWYIHQTFGLGEISCPETIVNAFQDQQLGLLPFGGVAVPLLEMDKKEIKDKTPVGAQSKTMLHVPSEKSHESNFKRKIGKAYCFLPLPIETGLPVHINGHFALDHEARRSLWHGGYRQIWNELLIKEVIVPSLANSILYMQDALVSKNLHRVSNWHNMNALIALYHSLFPITNSARDETWKFLTEQFYKSLASQRVPLFPVVQSHCSSDSGSTFDIKWTPLGWHGHPFDGVFSDMNKYFSFHTKSVWEFEAMLKELGVKLIATPKEIRKAIDSCGIQDVSVSSPNFIIAFLKSFQDKNKPGHFDIENINCPLQMTKFKTISILKAVLKFILLSESFMENAEGLPIILTSDGILKPYSCEKKVFYFKYTDLLPMSKRILLHEEMLPYYSGLCSEKRSAVARLTVDDFVNLLPDSFHESCLEGSSIVLWDKTAGKPVAVKWLADLFNFLFEEAQETTVINFKSYTHTNQKKFQTYISKLESWKFLPTKCFGLNQSYLFPMSFRVRTLVPTCYLDENLLNVLLKLALPQIDESTFELCEHKFDVLTAMQKCVASVDNPYELLVCLTHYKSNIVSCDLNPFEAMTLMSFFSRKMKTLKEKGCQVYVYLRSLPLYVTQHYSLVDLQSHSDVVVLPAGIPSSGILEWSTATGVLLLKRFEELTSLYKCLQIPELTAELVYKEWVLPRIDRMPSEYWLEHITYIKENLLPPSLSGFSDRQKQMIGYIRNIAFVQVGEQMKCVNELYNPDHTVFKCMLSETSFPPQQFRTYDWRRFFDELGLINQPTDSMMLSFAHEIEADGLNTLNELTKQKSIVLVDYFLLNIADWQKQTLTEMSTIQFVIPYRVSEELNRIFVQHKRDANLIRFQGSTYEGNARLCWTTVNILPKEICVNDTGMENVLGISAKVKVQEVSQHCQNICDKLKNLLDKNEVRERAVKMLMEEIYSFLEKHIPLDKDTKKRMKYTPVVFIPTERQMVTSSKVVVELLSDEEVQPYLFQAPKYYGKFHDLFVEIGAAKKVTWMHYAVVLEQMKNEEGSSSLFMVEKDWIKTALQNMFRMLKHPKPLSKDMPITEIKTLYLPNRSMILENSTGLVVVDNPDLEKRLSERVKMSYFIGFNEMDIQVSSAQEALKMLPSELQPKLLSQIISEDVILADIKELSSQKARTIERFIHSGEFMEGILRLVKHQLKKDSVDMDREKHAIPICNNLQETKIVKVSGLKTVLTSNHEAIAGTEMTKRCFIKYEMDSEGMCYTMYFQEDCESDPFEIETIIEEDGGLTDLIDYCTMQLLGTTIRHLPTILRLIKEPNKIKSKLFQLKIGEYSITESVATPLFPPPGTIVETKFHPFLEQGMYPFRTHEFKYAALELEDELEASDDVSNSDSDDSNDLPEPVYIYVHIIKEIKEHSDDSFVRIQYQIDAGRYNQYSSDSDSHVVSISRLYRFVRKENEISTSVVVYGSEAVGSMPFDETCRRIRMDLVDAWKLPESDKRRVIKRLQLKWHPDKNPHNVEYCTRVFHYIQEIIMRLERGEDVGMDENVDDETGRAPPNFSSSRYHKMGCNINRRAGAYARAWTDNYDDYTRSTRTGNFSHPTTAEAVIPNISEARRWLRQAKNDYLAAVESMPSLGEVKGFNWVCYQCHQLLQRLKFYFHAKEANSLNPDEMSCEKALKAAWFAKNANNQSVRQSHSLTLISSGLSMELIDQATQIENRLGQHTCMRYPDSVAGLRIPSDVFSRNDAEYVMEITAELLDNVEQRF